MDAERVRHATAYKSASILRICVWAVRPSTGQGECIRLLRKAYIPGDRATDIAARLGSWEDVRPAAVHMRELSMHGHIYEQMHDASPFIYSETAAVSSWQNRLSDRLACFLHISFITSRAL